MKAKRCSKRAQTKDGGLDQTHWWIQVDFNLYWCPWCLSYTGQSKKTWNWAGSIGMKIKCGKAIASRSLKRTRLMIDFESLEKLQEYVEFLKEFELMDKDTEAIKATSFEYMDRRNCYLIIKKER